MFGSARKTARRRSLQVYQKIREQHLAELDKQTGRDSAVCLFGEERALGETVRLCLARDSGLEMTSYFSSQTARGRTGIASTPRELARQLACNRREFLRNAAGLALGSALLGSSAMVRRGHRRQEEKSGRDYLWRRRA